MFFPNTCININYVQIITRQGKKVGMSKKVKQFPFPSDKSFHKISTNFNA